MKLGLLTAALVVVTGCQQGAESERIGNSAVSSSIADSSKETSPPTGDGRSTAAPADGRISRYSSLGTENCKLVEQSDEGPYWRMHCSGVDGFSVDYTESDLRQGIAVFAPGVADKRSLEIASKVANGAFENLGSRIEWRGDAGEPPDALIVRVNVAREDGGPDQSLLAVAKLRPTPCVIGIIGAGATQNTDARVMADKGGGCL